MKIEEVHYETLTPARWRANHTFRPELKVLTDSLLKHGWLYPIVVWGDGVIVDGTARWYLAQSDKKLLKRHEGMVPITRLEGDEVDAMIAHVRLNRAHGEIIPRSLSLLVNDIVMSGKYDVDTLQKEFRMSLEEMSLLLDANLLKVRKVDEFKYSPAWVPVESNGLGAPVFERPPNSDT